jgi:hypothetical protein
MIRVGKVLLFLAMATNACDDDYYNGDDYYVHDDDHGSGGHDEIISARVEKKPQFRGDYYERCGLPSERAFVRCMHSVIQLPSTVVIAAPLTKLRDLIRPKE